MDDSDYSIPEMKDNFDYVPVNYDLYEDVNDLPLRMDDGNVSINKSPEWMKRIIGDTCVSLEGKIMFMRRFGIYYLTDPNFRELTQKYSFLFFEREYIGVYPSERDAYFEGTKLRDKTQTHGMIYLPYVGIRIDGYEYI